MTFLSLLPWEEVRERLQEIYPEGTPDRHYVVREMAAKTVLTALYVGAVEGEDRWIAPRHVVRMGDEQVSQQDDEARDDYYVQMNKSNAPSPHGRWYAENSREPLRDEVIRQGLVPTNAMVERSGIPTTSPKGRYALQREFAALFNPALEGDEFAERAASWRGKNLSAAALARAALVRSSSSTASGNITVACPNGPSLVLPPGPSPRITKAVVEVFAPTFLADPRVAWISDSGSKSPFRNSPLENALQINLDAAELLPDVVLVDLAPPSKGDGILIVFVEVVASDGPVTTQRQEALLDLIGTSALGYSADDAAFVTAYLDRAGDPARRTMSSLAWRSFAWFVSEPDRLIQLHDGSTASRKLGGLL